MTCKKALALLIASIISVSCCSCGNREHPASVTAENTTVSTAQSTEEITTATEEATVSTTATTTEATITTEATTKKVLPPIVNSASLIFAGDNLIHSSIYKQAKRRAEAKDMEGYDFSYVYEQVAHYIEEADFAVLNQETIITDEFEPSTYPRFCSPTDLGEQMIALGFDAFSLSNNHILDKGEAGLNATLDFWDEHPESVVYGAYRNKEDMDNIRTAEINGITFAFLGYMEHTNGLSLKDGAVCEITYLKETELVKAQVQRANEIADVVIVSPHFGKETTNKLTENQVAIAKLLAEWGADIIVGTQPHTAQTVELITREDGTEALVYYCLGNFVSAQQRDLTMVGILGGVTVSKNMTTGEISFSDIKAIPLITQYGYNYSNVHIVPYVNYTDELLAEHGNEDFDQGVIDHVLSFIPKEYLSVE